jgi:hypothetical protein
MVCLMELSSHLLRASVSGRYDINEMRLAAQLAESAPDNSITLFDRGFTLCGCCSPGIVRAKIATG